MTYSQKHYTALNGLYDYMSEILGLYKSVIPMLKKELDAILKDDTIALDASMNAQQAVILKTRNFDEKMAEFSKNIEVPSGSLRELASHLPADEGERFTQLYLNYQTTLEEVLFYRNKCKEMLTTKLHSIETKLNAVGSPTENTTYNNLAGEVQTSLFPKSFQTKA